MHTFIKNGIRGGITQCSNRQSVVNNKYMTSIYDSSKPSSYLMYLDVNNLYGWAMSQYLPYGGFKWFTDLDRDNVNKIMKTTSDSSIGYILEVDLDYPNYLHDLHNDLPFCIETKCSVKSKFPKLIPDLTNKTKYIIYYRNIQQSISEVLKLTKVHRVKYMSLCGQGVIIRKQIVQFVKLERL